jgi:hypothetical protein
MVKEPFKIVVFTTILRGGDEYGIETTGNFTWNSNGKPRLGECDFVKPEIAAGEIQLRQDELAEIVRLLYEKAYEVHNL